MSIEAISLLEASKMALEALESIDEAMPFPVAKNAMKQLRQAIEQAQKQEPVAVVGTVLGGTHMMYGDQYLGQSQDKKAVFFLKEVPEGTHLYTSPPQRHPLTVEQLREHWQVAKVLDMTNAEIDFADYVLIARDVEALHGIKE